jgi:hypothetical protein
MATSPRRLDSDDLLPLDSGMGESSTKSMVARSDDDRFLDLDLTNLDLGKSFLKKLIFDVG